MKISAWSKTDKGRRRDSNQDCYLIDESLGCFIVADGMGGHSGGEVASKMAVEGVQSYLSLAEAQSLDPQIALLKAYEAASQQIFERATSINPELAGMGTTLVMLYRRGKNLYIANVGDSRCYLFCRPHLWQLTEDHSLINEQLRAGLMSEQQAMNSSGRNVITRSVGYEREVRPDILKREIQKGDTYLLCSDGLSGMIDDESINDIFLHHTPEQAVDLLIERALDAGGDDNVTVMVVHVES